jgi:hypothetical protein
MSGMWLSKAEEMEKGVAGSLIVVRRWDDFRLVTIDLLFP